MHSKTLMSATAILAASLMFGCTTTSAQRQRQAELHQQRSDAAAQRGAYGEAESEQRKAHDEHHEAVKKAIEEGKPIPPQPAIGDEPAPQER